MKKSILNIGKALNKAEQKEINGGRNWNGFCFPSEAKCNHYCTTSCSPCGVSSFGYTPHVCGSNMS